MSASFEPRIVWIGPLANVDARTERALLALLDSVHRNPVYRALPDTAPKRKVKPGQTPAEADARIRAAEAKRRRRALSPAARRYLDLLDRYLSLPDVDEAMEDALNAAHDDLTPDDVRAIAAWHEVHRFCDRCPGRGAHLMSCIAYKGGHVDLHEPCRGPLARMLP